MGPPRKRVDGGPRTEPRSERWREQKIVGISVHTVGNNIRIKEWLK